MSEDDRALGVTVSLYNSQINKIREHVKHSKRFKTEAAFFQHIIDEYFNRNKRDIGKQILFYMVYPLLLTSLMLYVAMSTDSINRILADKGYYLVELIDQSNYFFLIGFGCLSLTIISIYVMIQKIKKGN